jgi:RhtB (resistance to homoserine/threonine) family protein
MPGIRAGRRERKNDADTLRPLVGHAIIATVLDQLLVIVSVTALVMVTPGPDMLLVLRNTFAGGRRAGLHTSAGILSGNLVHITYCVLGIGLIISQSIRAFSTLKFAAAAYLVYLGVMSLRSGAQTLDPHDVQGRRPDSMWFVHGFVNNLLNPKGTLFYLGVFTTVITPDTSARTMLVLILSMMLVSASFWIVFVLTLDRPMIRHSLERSQQTMSRICGALLILFGIRVASMSR